MIYEGLHRPPELALILDGPVNRYSPDIVNDEKEQKVLGQYFHDLYEVFMKKFSHFFIAPEMVASETVKLQAMLQEMIKVKMLISKNK